ncbi:MAG: large subunit ribosomal protein L13 [Parcubacteria group bacterium LiPW_39]|nr:MAG: large subunit ribosomal protein L13 [Parcubacteria group bacterium LiPW_39]
MKKQPEKKEYTIDAAGKILGRLASAVAVWLRGKQQTGFLPYREPKNQVIVFNTDKITVTGKKMKQKLYIHHTGYAKGLRKESLEDLFARDSREVLRRAVYGMLPKNRSRDKIIKNLKLFKGEIKH